MKTITEQLADALRAVLTCRGIDDTEQTQGETYRAIVNTALATYDAQQVTPPGLWAHWTDGERDYIGPAAGGDFIAEFPKNSEHAARIVKCVNAHDGLVSALELARNGLQWYRAEFPDADNDADAEAEAAITDALAQAGVTP